MSRSTELSWLGDPDGSWPRRWESFQAEAGPYWACHRDFEDATTTTARWLVGTHRAGDVWINVLIPTLIAAAQAAGDESLRERVLALYAAHPPLQSNRKTRWVGEHVIGSIGVDRSTPAHVQQGMLDLHDRYCEPRRCSECPLKEASS